MDQNTTPTPATETTPACNQTTTERKPNKFGTIRLLEDAMVNQMWMRRVENEDPTKETTIRRGFKVVHEDAIVEVPNGATLVTVTNKEGVTYTHFAVNPGQRGQVDVHLHGELINSVSPGQVFKAQVVVYLLVWEREGDRERGCSRQETGSYANYSWNIDLYPSTDTDLTTAEFRLEIADTDDPSTSRKERTIVDHENRRFAHCSLLGDIDQDIRIRRIEHVTEQPTTPLVAAPVAQPRTEVGRITLNGRGAKPIGGGALADKVKDLMATLPIN